MKTLYLDCFSGISGDMCLAALLDLGVVPHGDFLVQMSNLIPDEYTIKISKTSKNAISATDVDVIVHECHSHTHETEHKHPHEHDHDDHHHRHTHSHTHHIHTHDRNLADIKAIIYGSGISDLAKSKAVSIFQCIAKAEAKVHGTDIDSIHFHEVGAVDSIVDIVGVGVIMDMLGVERVVCSPLSEGHGFVKCQHGLIPVPVPATAQILSEANAPIRSLDIQSELITPTGAGIVAALSSEFGSMPDMSNTKIGYGAGKKDFTTPNVLRVFFGDSEFGNESITVIETNIDDMTGENAGFVMDLLLDAGALDVFFTPIQMKKNRPAIMLSVLCEAENTAQLEDIIFSQTTTIGIRKYQAARRVLARAIVDVQTPWGVVSAKVSRHKDAIKVVPEYQDVARIAKQYNILFNDVYQAAKMGNIT